MYVLRDAGALANIRARPDAFADAAGDWRAFLERTPPTAAGFWDGSARRF